MAHPPEFWIRLYQVFNPYEVLVGQRSKDFYCEREHSPFDDMLLDFRREMQPIRPPVAFFTGHRGSGKSSLLFRLLENFKKEYFVVYFDIEYNLDAGKANQIDMLYLFGATVFKVAEDEGLKPDPDNLIELAESVYTVTYESKEKVKEEALNASELVKGLVCFGASVLGGGVGEKLAEAALKPFTFSSGVSEDVARKREIEPQAQEIINNVNLIIADVQTRADKPVLVVVDGLDKLRRLEQAELIFLESRALQGPVCRIIYTVPMLIFGDARFGQVEEECESYLFPNVRLYEKTSDDQKYENGYEILREVVSKRLATLNLTSDDVFEPEILDSLIAKSGGMVRTFIGLARDAFKKAEQMKLDKVDRNAAQTAIDDRAASLGGRLTRESILELRQVRREKRPSGNKESSELLHGLFIVAYRNNTAWFDAHPLIWDYL